MIVPEPFAEEISTTTGTGSLTLAGASDARHQTVNAAIGTNGVTGYYLLDGNGTDWECGVGTSTGATGFSRDAVWKSTNADAKISLSANTHTLRLAPIPGADVVGEPGGRLSLHPTDPSYDPQNSVASSGQDTTADTVTLTAHGWATGTMVASSATSGGLTAGTTYYINAASANTVSFHTTLAAAIAGTSKVDITGTVTATITAFGMAAQSVWYIPAKHNRIQLWNGAFWQWVEFTATELAIGTVTTSIGYDIFAYISGGALAIEKLAWASSTARATDVTLQDGRWCKSGDKTRLYIGSLYSRDTTSTESSKGGVISNVGGKRFLFCANHYDVDAGVIDTTDNWSYTTATVRQARATAGNKVEVFAGLPCKCDASLISAIFISGISGAAAETGIGLDSTTVNSANESTPGYNSGASSIETALSARKRATLTIGYHYLAWLEKGTSGSNVLFLGDNGGGTQSGLGVRFWR